MTFLNHSCQDPSSFKSFAPCVCASQVASVMSNFCYPMDHSPQGSSVHGVLECFAMPSFRRSSWPRNRTHISCRPCIGGWFFTTEPPGKLTGRPVHKCMHVIMTIHSHSSHGKGVKTVLGNPEMSHLIQIGEGDPEKATTELTEPHSCRYQSIFSKILVKQTYYWYTTSILPLKS